MNLQFYLEKLHSSDEFKEFKKENPKAYLCSSFIMIDREKNTNEIHFDFFILEKNVVGFRVDEEIIKLPLQSFDENPPEKISEEINFDFKKIENLILEKMEKENIKSKIQKIILSLQNVKGETFLLGTVFVSMLGLLKINISLPEMKITEFEKKSIFDIMNIFKKKE